MARRNVKKSIVKVSRLRRLIVINGLIDVNMFLAVSLELLKLQLDDPVEPITLVIDYSEGGYSAVGMALAMSLKYSIAPVHTVVRSLAASAALMIFLAGKKRTMVRGAKILPHLNAQVLDTEATLNAIALRGLLQHLMRWDDKVFELVHSATGLSRTKIKKIFYAEEAISGSHARKLHLATHLISQKKYRTIVS